jgi:hypothetical protein
VPLSINYPRKMKMDGSNPTLLEGYGAYGYPSQPYFESTRLAWHEPGGVYAICHVRGGGEYGEEWHLAGKGSTKPNTWKDFIACAQYLIDNKYTSPSHLAGTGGDRQHRETTPGNAGRRVELPALAIRRARLSAEALARRFRADSQHRGPALECTGVIASVLGGSLRPGERLFVRRPTCKAPHLGNPHRK